MHIRDGLLGGGLIFVVMEVSLQLTMGKRCFCRLWMGTGALVLVLTAGCQKVPEPKKEVDFHPMELKAKALIENVAGEISERNEQGRITMVVLSGPEVTDATLKHLEVLENLTILELRDTKITKKGYDLFRKTRPNCEISFGPGDAPPKKEKEE